MASSRLVEVLVFFFFWEPNMNAFVKGLKRFHQDEEGVTAIEYGLIAALIAVVIIIAVKAVGTNLNAIFTKIAGELDNATP
jgi:pilus assembly protein Flp/PilA